MPPTRTPAQTYNPANPLIVQGDRTILLETFNPLYAEARDAIAPFAELEKSPEHIHTYRLTPLSLWNAAAAGMTAEAMVDALPDVQQVPAPAQPAGRPPRDWSAATAGSGSSGSTRPAPADHRGQARCWKSWPASTKVRDYLGERIDATSFAIDDAYRGRPEAGPDRASATRPRTWPGTPRGRRCRSTCATVARDRACRSHVRDYQRMAVDAFHAGGDVRGGSGVIVLPCGAGKTIVGIAAMAALKKIDAGPDHQHHGRRAVAARDPRQDRPRRRRRSPPTPATPRRSARSRWPPTRSSPTGPRRTATSPTSSSSTSATGA